MAKEESISIEGTVVEALTNSMYRIQADIPSPEGKPHLILGHASGKIKKNNIMIMPGDRVIVEVSPYDLTRGRVVYRLK